MARRVRPGLIRGHTRRSISRNIGRLKSRGATRTEAISGALTKRDLALRDRARRRRRES